MRTTIDLEDDLLLAAKEMARRQNLRLGQVISRLTRRAMTIPVDASPAASTIVAGFRPVAGRGRRQRPGQCPARCRRRVVVALLDFTVLIALLDGGHLHHSVATQWLDHGVPAHAVTQ
jgi:predicted DNA-binding ribbon-helix-helix protein